MTGPNDRIPDDQLVELFAQLPGIPGVDPEELAGGAIRRGRQRRLRRQRGMAAASSALVLALALPALAASGSDDQSIDTAGTSSELDDPAPHDDEQWPSEQDDELDATTTTAGTEPDATTTTTKPAADHDEPDATTTTAAPDYEQPKPTTTTTMKPELEPLELWCARGSGEEAGGVVCESSISEHEDFAAYHLYRRCADGGEWEVVATYEQRTMPDRPWPDIRWFDPGVDSTYGWLYKVVAVDGQGHMIGISNKVTVAATAEPAAEPAVD